MGVCCLGSLGSAICAPEACSTLSEAVVFAPVRRTPSSSSRSDCSSGRYGRSPWPSGRSRTLATPYRHKRLGVPLV